MVIQASKPSESTDASIQSQYEIDTQAIARQLLTATQEKKNFLAQMREQMRWDDKLLDWTMGNPGLRVQMFRFIDCLPSLKSKAEIARHFQEYLSDPSVELPTALKGLLNFASPDSMPAQVAATTVSTAVETLARKYIAGETLKQAVKTIEQLRKQKMSFTVDLLGEAVITEQEAQSYLTRYLDLMQQLTSTAKKWPIVPQIDEASGHPLSKVQVSVKLTAFYSQFDPLDADGSERKVSGHIRTLLRRAHELGAMVHFDMEQYRYKDLTIAILQRILMEDEFKSRSDIGVTLQAYLRDSEYDLLGWIDWAKSRGTPITIRLVKGAYWDQETIISRQNHWTQPVYSHKSSTDANFERMTQILLENHDYLYAAIGSHNVRSQAMAIAIAKALKIPPRRIELQVLYGMADKLAKALVEQGFRVRVYCPYGELIPGMSYLIRRLLENTANSSFLKQSLGDIPPETLLAPPTMMNDDSTTASPLDTDTSLNAPHVTSHTLIENASDTDFSDAEQRQHFFASIQSVRQQLGQTYLPLINGKRVNTQDEVNSVNPANPNEIIGTVGRLSVDQAEDAMKAAKAAFKSWKTTPASERSAIIRKAANLLEERRTELCAWMMLEGGKTLHQSDPEVSEAADFCRYYADEMERLDRGYTYDVAGETDHYRYQPRGVVVVISPWNFPLAIPMGMTVAALVTGNCALLKPAETTSVIGSKIAEILVDAGVPDGVFQYVPGRGSTVGEYFVQHPDTHMIVFTGSQEVGCRIYAEASILKPGQKHMKRVIAEMGGKNAIIVDESADLDQAVQGVVYSAFGYSGQKCSACSRVVVMEPIYEIFVERLIEATQSLNVGRPEDPSTKVGPVIDAAAQSRIQSYIETGKQQSTLALSMEVPDTGYYIGPTIFTDVQPDHVIAQEEIFGPVLAVMKAQHFDEALAIANGTNFALTGGLYSRTSSHIERAYDEFEVGNLYINRSITGAIVARQPFGGFKLSGVGTKAGGPDYLLQFLEPRHISENVQRQGFAPIEGMD